MRHWLTPLLVALAVAVSVAVLGPRFIDTRPGPAEAWERPYVLPFAPDPNAGGQFLVVAPLGQATAVDAMRSDGLAGLLSWQSPNVGILRVESNATPCGCAQSQPNVALEVYVVSGAGQLLASNSGANETTRFARSSHYTTLPNGTWSMEESAWRASRAVPTSWRPLLDPLRLQLLDASPGAVVTEVVAEHPQRSALGPLYVTVRVESRAP